MTTVNVKFVFGRQRDARPAPRAPLPAEAPTLPLASLAATGAPVSRTTRMLALGYKVRRLLDSGVLADQGEAAARLGIVSPQMTQILNLTYLSPRIQARLLSGELVVSEHALRPLCRVIDWTIQETAVGDSVTS